MGPLDGNWFGGTVVVSSCVPHPYCDRAEQSATTSPGYPLNQTATVALVAANNLLTRLSRARCSLEASLKRQVAATYEWTYFEKAAFPGPFQQQLSRFLRTALK